MGLFSSILARIGLGGKSQAAPAPTVPLWRQTQTGATSTPASPMTPEERQRKLDSLTVKGQVEDARYTEWQPVSSSWIEALRYNPLVPFAQMRVKGGKVYTFGGMTFDVFKAWLMSPSKGQYFTQKLMGRYTQWADFVSVGKGIKAEQSRAFGTTVLKELGIK